jgi:LPS export ABC transporter protein LptC/lipopolysaccharide transport protein LptA
MQEIRRKRTTWLGLRLRAGMPQLVRKLALLLLVAGMVFVGISYYRQRNHKEFRLRSGPAVLSKEVVGVIDNLEHNEMKNGRLYLSLRATRDVKYSDGHHELENVHLEVYPEHGDHPDKITAARTITNDDNTEFAFNGNVQIETRDRLLAKTESIDYDMRDAVGVANAPISFERENVSGRADSATIDSKNKRLELRGAVEITVQPDAQGKADASVPVKVNPRGGPVVIKSAQANFDQATLLLSFSGGAVAEQGKEVMSGDTLTGRLDAEKHLRGIETRGNSYLRSLTEGRAAEVFSVNMDFFFNSQQKLERAVATTDVRANTLDADSEMRMTTPGTAEVFFVVQAERSLLKEIRAAQRSIVTLAAPKSKAGDPKAANKRLAADTLRLFWRETGRDLERAEASGNAELVAEPVQPSPTADRKTLLAPRFDCDFFETGNLARAFTASGGAKAVIVPLQPSETRATRTLTAQLMVAQFVRATQDVERIESRGESRFNELERTLTSDKMTAQFSPTTQGLERVDAQGDAKFNERDRNGQSANMTYTSGDAFVRMRGGEPVVWDARARMKAAEIDSDSRNKISYGRGKATTTYYSQEQTNGAAPFKSVKSPVFIAANSAEFQHDSGVGIYTGAARAWQDDNFVKADRIILRRELKRMEADGNVQSALYQARRKEADGTRTVVPVFATSNRMSYTDAERLVHYEGDVDIKQGTERITSAVSDVFLLKDSYEVERSIAQRNVVVTQPGRRGTGEWAQYTAADESVVLTGSPARVEDAAKGNSESRRLTVFLRENRVVSDGGGEGKQNTGRVRTTHKIRKQ